MYIPERDPKVGSDISSRWEDDDSLGLRLEDIVSIKAIRFKDAYGPTDVIGIIADKHVLDVSEIEEIDVTMQDYRPSGTHAYKLMFYDGWETLLPIWEEYLEELEEAI